MALETLAPTIRPNTETVEPSRAWILGLVIESDGSVSGPGSQHALEWPAADDTVESVDGPPEGTVV
jgi:hypothetical protein